MKERPIRKDGHIHLLYESAYTLGFMWRDRVPEATYDVLLMYLRDNSVLFIQKSESGVGGASAETKGGKAIVKERISGDARMNAVEALERIGVSHYKKRDDIMQELKKLASSAAFQPLRDHAERLVKAAEK